MKSHIATVATCPDSVLLVSSRRAHESSKSYLFTDPEYTFTLESLDDFHVLLEHLDTAPSKGLYAAGYVSYECGYAVEPSLRPLAPDSETPFAWFGFYRSPLVFDYVPQPANEFPPLKTQLGITKQEYFRKFDEIKQHIKAGNTYQVNFTTRLTFKNTVDPATLFAHLMTVQPVEFGAFININGMQIISASPELFFRRHGERIITRPMKGTAPRGFTHDEQQVNMDFLRNDPKNRAENVMIVDLLRNDLRRICRVNTVTVEELFDVEVFPTVLQMVSTVSGVLRPSIRYSDIFSALFPCGSITGAPKVRTMQIIRQLEDHPRGVYTGTIGFISPHEEASFSVAIRTLTLSPSGSMGIGGGIVWDSDAQEEYDECLLKATFLNRPSFSLIETMLWDQKYHFLDEHLERLITSADFFGFPCPDIRARLPLYFQSPQRVRLLLAQDGTLSITHNEISLNNSPITVMVSEHSTSPDVFLRHKTTRRKLYDSQFSSAQCSGYDDVIFVNSEGHVTEGAIHNIFVVKNGRWTTPPLSDGLLPGILRAHLDVAEEHITLEDLISVDEVYLGNSVRGLRKVKQIDKLGKTIWGSREVA